MAILDLWKIIVLAVVQGVTEFLPISSSGHLVILAALLSPNGKTDGLDVLTLNIVLHAGTLGSILVVYWHRLWRMLGQDRRMIGVLIVGTLPAVAVGVLLEITGDTVLENPLVAGCMLPVTGLILLASRWWTSGHGEYTQVSYRSTLLIGLVQSFAILPGISRSGSTITAGMQQKLSPGDAATFSFLLAVPALCGAVCKELLSLVKDGPSDVTPIPALHLALGALVSFLVGIVALLWLIKLIDRGRLHYFAWWCIPVGIGVIVWQLSLMAGQ